MAKIDSYVIKDAPLSGSDKMIGTDTANNNATKNFTISELASFIGDGVTLQQVLDNDHSLTDSLNFQGTSAGDNNSGVNINAFGDSALKNNSGNNNNAFGYWAGRNNSGVNINALGANAAFSNTGISVNALGDNSAYTNSGDSVNAIGSYSASSNTGSNVNALGNSAANGNTGDYVNFFGPNAGSNNTFSYVTLFGPGASADDNSQLVFLNSSGYNSRISNINLSSDRGYELPDNSGTFVLSVNGTTPDSLGNITVAAPTLQQVLDNNHSLTNGNNFQGTSAGISNSGAFVNALGVHAADNNSGTLVNALGSYAAASNSGVYVNALGQYSAQANSGSSVNALGNNAAKNNSGSNVNAFGNGAGQNNTYSNVTLFGAGANANGNNQLTFANSAGSVGRISFNSLTSNHGYTLPDADGNFVLSVNGTAPDTSGNVTISTGVSYKSYVINLGWDGTTWTVTNTYQNTLGVTPTLSAGIAGRLKLTATGVFVSGKTVVVPCVISGQAILLGVLDLAFSSFPDDISIRWNNASGGIATPASFGTNIPYILEVRVYN